MSMEKVLTLHQATKLLNVCPETLRRWEKDGELRPFRTLGGHRRPQKLAQVIEESDYR
jgi:excisionase family DNA binding protein